MIVHKKIFFRNLQTQHNNKVWGCLWHKLKKLKPAPKDIEATTSQSSSHLGSSCHITGPDMRASDLSEMSKPRVKANEGGRGAVIIYEMMGRQTGKAVETPPHSPGLDDSLIAKLRSHVILHNFSYEWRGQSRTSHKDYCESLELMVPLFWCTETLLIGLFWNKKTIIQIQ